MMQQQQPIIKDLTPDTKLFCLIGDVGGTNVRLAIKEISLKTEYQYSEQIKFHTYHTSEYGTFEEFILHFLQDVKEEQYPKFSVIGIAGPISGNKTDMANTKWGLIDGNLIAQNAKIPYLVLINDFQAVAYGILGLGINDLIPLTNTHARPNSVITILGPGTGVGVSRLIPLTQGGKSYYQVWPCEGGHTCYSPTNELEWKYMKYLVDKLKVKHLVTERAWAGQAIPYMYYFLREQFNDLERVLERDIGEDKFKIDDKDFPSKKIFEYGVQKKDELCTKVVDFFISQYGVAIGDLICNTLPYGGVYLFGSMSVGVAEYIQNNPDVNFLQEYISSREYMRGTFEQIPIYVIKKVDLGMEGSYNGALRLLEQNDMNKSL